MKSFLNFSAFLAIAVGIAMVIGGGWAVSFTHQNIVRENIVTPTDASFPSTPVRGPFTLHAQANVIRKHTLESTDGQTYAEMSRTVPQVDGEGKPVFDEEGKQVMVPNTARDIWVTATTFTTALNLAIITYAFSSLIILLGLILIWTGFVFRSIAKTSQTRYYS